MSQKFTVGMSASSLSPKHFPLNSTGERVVGQKSFHPTQNHYEEPHHCFTSAELKTEVSGTPVLRIATSKPRQHQGNRKKRVRERNNKKKKKKTEAVSRRSLKVSHFIVWHVFEEDSAVLESAVLLHTPQKYGT